MSGTIDYSALLAPIGGSPAAATTLLSAIYGSTAASPGDAVAALAQAERDQTRDVALTAAQPEVARDTAAFTKGVAAAKNVDQLLSNPAVLKVLLTANGLGDQLGYTALAKQALTSDLSDPKSLANQLANTAWKATAQTFQFATQGLAVIQQASVQQTLTSAYAEVQWRQSLDAAHPGLSDALTFRSEAGTISSVDQILGDPVLRNVVTTALGIPRQIAFQSLQAQEKAITSQLDITQFHNPTFVEQFTQRFLVAASANVAASSSTSLDSLAISATGLVI